jgi:CubicO group peptidase (beta-lactamase class C family)
MQTKLFSLFLLFFSISLVAQTKIDEKQLEKRLKDIQDITKTVGFSVAIVKNDKVVYAKGFGYSDLEKKLKADENTLYPIGSTSKAFTVGLLGIMEEEKGLSFSDSPKKYVPELAFYNDELDTKITILDMISHRTGLPRHDFSWYLFPTESKDSLMARIKYQKPFTGIREQWYYNNFMYLTLGKITEKLTDKSWEDNIRERFFKPLEMSRSNLNIVELAESTNVSKGYALEHFETNTETPYYNIAAMSPAGSINSSVIEMANWLKIWLNQGKFNGSQVLPQKYVEKAINPLMLVGSGIGDKQFPDQHLNSYGFAWFTSSYKGHYRLEHGGNIDGFSANVSFFPTDKIGIVVLSNQDGSALPTLVRNIITDEVLGLKKTDWVAYYTEKINAVKELVKKKKEEEKTVANTKPSHDLIEYTGTYTNPGYGTFSIAVENDSLFANFTRKKAFLKHSYYDIFKPYEKKNTTVESESSLAILFNFQTNDIGDIASVSLKLEPTLEPIIFERSPANVAVSKEKLDTYVGVYTLSGINVKVFLKDENLMLFVPGQPEYTLLPVKENEFVIKGLTGYKGIFETINGVLNLVMVQPNGTFKAIKK